MEGYLGMQQRQGVRNVATGTTADVVGEYRYVGAVA